MVVQQDDRRRLLCLRGALGGLPPGKYVALELNAILRDEIYRLGGRTVAVLGRQRVGDTEKRLANRTRWTNFWPMVINGLLRWEPKRGGWNGRFYYT